MRCSAPSARPVRSPTAPPRRCRSCSTRSRSTSEVTLADGAVDTLRFDLDMSSVVAAAAAEAGGGDLSGGTFVMTLLMDYDIDPSIDVVVPTGDFPDGTDQYLDLLAQG